ncbi:serine/threonine protein phosphatase [Clostridium chromiireducens]|uniref:Serine/threonine protein phosphatase n=1 Tax=Clostridium chromiireducens TaxID=225345 RepID=A0A964RS09_9CLOT|nr:metallophosphoesterase family protein [Clostridium chromiireducens]MVX66665.1 serine/threonine protein phosphatase [Clostridium chromiireducens]
MIKSTKKLIVTIITATMLVSTSIGVFAASNDGWTEARKTASASNGQWEKWCNEWETIKNNPTQISLTPGRNESELNFAWYSKSTEPKPSIKISKNKDMSNAKDLSVKSEAAVNGYISNKATAMGLEKSTTYYYSYQINEKWTNAIPYSTKNTDSFSFMFVGDPQIGSSSENVVTGEDKEQGQDNAVRNDSFNWNNTINTALKANPNISFVISAGDQIQSRDKKAPNKTYDKNEIEYAGYLSPEALKSIPVATTIGNHDAPSGNYSFHFNNPNASELGKTEAGGGYYYSYGNALFIVLNTNNYNIAEHKQLIEKAVAENKNAKWRIVTIHQDIYGSGEHSNEPEVVNLRYSLIPILEENQIDVVLTGHDHTYSRSLMLKGGKEDKAKTITEDEFESYIEGKTPIDNKYNQYLTSIEDKNSTKSKAADNNIVDPKGILYMTANSSSGSKYYDLVTKQQAYIAARWQEDIPTYSTITINDKIFSIDTFRTDTGAKIDNTFTITKTK